MSRTYRKFSTGRGRKPGFLRFPATLNEKKGLDTRDEDNPRIRAKRLNTPDSYDDIPNDAFMNERRGKKSS